MQMWTLRVNFISLLVWVPEAPMEQLQHGPTEIRIPSLTKKSSVYLSFGFHTVLPFQLELRVMQRNLHPWQSL